LQNETKKQLTQLNSTLFVPNRETNREYNEKWMDGTGLKGTEMH